MCVRNLYLKMHPENLAIARKNKKKRENAQAYARTQCSPNRQVNPSQAGVMSLLLPFDDTPSAPAVRVIHFSLLVVRAKLVIVASLLRPHEFWPRFIAGAWGYTSHASAFVFSGIGFGFPENSVLAGVETSPATRSRSGRKTHDAQRSS